MRMRDSVYEWTTWLAELMAGEISCLWVVWFKSHYTGSAVRLSECGRVESRGGFVLTDC